MMCETPDFRSTCRQPLLFRSSIVFAKSREVWNIATIVTANRTNFIDNQIRQAGHAKFPRLEVASRTSNAGHSGNRSAAVTISR